MGSPNSVRQDATVPLPPASLRRSSKNHPTPSVDGYVINSYQGIVFGEVISGVNMFKDIGAGLRNMFGGRSQGYEEELMKARNEAILEMQQRAEAMGAHAVVGVDIDYEVLGTDNGMLMVTASGTAVQLARRG